MREEESNWFAKWEDELPSPEELMPLSQTLITPDLAIAFDIPNPNSPNFHHHQALPQQPVLQHNQTNHIVVENSPQPNSSAEFDSDLGGTGGNGAAGSGCGSGLDESARTLKRPRLVWTPQLHKRFVDAVAHLGIKNAVPKTIMQLMSVDGLTRENVASHLQKYRLYLKRMQGINNGGSGNGSSPSGLSGSGVDTAMDRLFASAPVPAHFLRPNSDHYMPYPPVSMQVHHPQIAVQPSMVGHGQQLQQQFRHLGNSPPNAQFEHPFLVRQSQQQIQRIGTPIHGNGHHVMPTSYVENIEMPTAANGRKVLTLFPDGDD